MDKPNDWKNYDDFSAGIDTNRLPRTDILVNQKFEIALDNRQSLTFEFLAKDKVRWADSASQGEDWYEAIQVEDGLFFLDMTYASRPRDARTLIVNTKTRRVLSILSHVREARVAGEPLVTQAFEPGVLDGAPAAGMVPAPTRELIGTRTRMRYSPNHLYEHTYLNSGRYCWQCLKGEQRGHGDVDLVTYYKFDHNQYVFCFREFIIPVASVFFFNYNDLRSTGKFLGVTGDGKISNDPAGAFITKTSMNDYDLGEEPV